MNTDIKYTNDALKILDYAKKILNENDWYRVKLRNDILLERKDVPDSNVPYFRVTAIINKPKNDLIMKIWNSDPDNAKKNDSSINYWKEIESGNNYKVISQFNKLGPSFVIWPRHTVIAQVKLDDINNDINNVTYIIGYSIDHPFLPESFFSNTHVRANVHMSIYIFTSEGQNKTKILRIARVDPNGDVPMTIINSFAGNVVDMIESWKY